jgi:uncharacterized protein (TIGR02611 family)
MIERVRERKELHKQRGRLYRLGFGVAGGLVILAGLVLSLPGVPGPGIVLILVGLGMLALEFDRAERLLERVLDRVEQATEASRGKKLVAVGILAAAAAVLAVAVLLWDVPLVPFES